MTFWNYRYTVSVDGKEPTELTAVNSEFTEDKVTFYWKKDNIGGSKVRFNISCESPDDLIMPGPSYIKYGEKGANKDCEGGIYYSIRSE